jgi:hypothetical protein
MMIRSSFAAMARGDFSYQDQAVTIGPALMSAPFSVASPRGLVRFAG